MRARPLSAWGTRAVLLGIGAYRSFLSPLKPACCRFVPSCSEYAAEAVETHGLRVGLGLAVRRILRCHPWHPGGWDPVLASDRSAGGKSHDLVG